MKARAGPGFYFCSPHMPEILITILFRLASSKKQTIMSGRGCFNCGGCAWFCCRWSPFSVRSPWFDSWLVFRDGRFILPRDHYSFTPFLFLLQCPMCGGVRVRVPTFCRKMVVNILLFDLSSYDYNQHYSFRCPTSQVQRHMNYMARPRTPTSQCDFTMSAHAHHHLHIESFSCYSNPFHASISLFQISCIWCTTSHFYL